jgi:hypothetical protein
MIRKVLLVLSSVLMAAGWGLTEEVVSKKEFDALKAEVMEFRRLMEAKSAQTASAEDPESRCSLESDCREVPAILEGIELGAVVELEVGYASSDGEDTSDMTVATIEVATGWQLDDWLRVDVVFLYEEDDSPFDVDQAYVTMGNTEEFPLYLQVGRMYVPFGNFDSAFLSDPLALEIGETLESAALLGLEAGGFSFSVAAFNGDVEGDGEDHVENLVVAASYSIEGDNSSLSFGGSWIRNITDSDGIEGALDGAAAQDEQAGVNAWVTASVGPVTAMAEYVKVLDEITALGDIEPEALNLEIAVAVSDSVELAAKYETADDVDALGLAEERYGVVCSYSFPETDLYSMGVSVEYIHEEFEGGEDGDVVTAQLAVEF